MIGNPKHTTISRAPKHRLGRALMATIVGLLLALTGLVASTPPAQAAVLGDDYPAYLKAAAKDALTDPWLFYNRECTSFVAWRLNNANGVAFTNYYGGHRWSDATNWKNAAQQSTIPVRIDNTPAVGAVAWWSSGHVAWVAEVNGSNITIEEYNYAWNGNYNKRVIPASSVTNFLHVKDLPSTPPPPADADGDGVPDNSDQCPNISGPSSNNGCPFVDGRVYLPSKYGPAECGRVGDKDNPHLACNLWRKGKWVSIVSPWVDWGYPDTRGWIANRDGTISKCVSVGVGNQLRCDTFTGYKWTSRTSPVTDLGYQSAVDGRVFLPTKYGPAECGRAGGDTAQTLVCNLWRKGTFRRIYSPVGTWGSAERGWVANRDGTISRCAAVTGNQMRCDTFTGYKWTSRLSPQTDLGYQSAVDGRVFLPTKYGPAECGRADSEANQRLVCSLWRKGRWVSISSPIVAWGTAERSWVANRDGTVSHCAAVTGNQMRCDTFTGYKWTSRLSPDTDLGYGSSVDGRVFLPTKYGPAECGRAGGDTAQALVCNVWRKGTFRRISSPVGIWGGFDTARWVTNRDGTVSRCAVASNQWRCDTFTGYRWTSRTAPVSDLGYIS